MVFARWSYRIQLSEERLMNEQDIQTALALLRDLSSRLDTITELTRLRRVPLNIRTSSQLSDIVREVHDILENAHYNKSYDEHHLKNEGAHDARYGFNKDCNYNRDDEEDEEASS